MPYKYKIDDFLKVVFFEADGHVSSKEIALSYSSLLNDQKWQPGFTIINDYTNGDLSSLRPSDWRYIFTYLTPHKQALEQSKIALIAPNDMEFGTARMGQTIGARVIKFMVFRDCDSASSWLLSDVSTEPGAQIMPQEERGYTVPGGKVNQKNNSNSGLID